MSKLHEVLAVERDLEAVASKVTEEAVITFTKKVDHFTGHVRTLKMFDEKRAGEEVGQGEIKEITTTVPAKLGYVANHILRYYDVLAQKDATNQLAKADVVLSDGTVILTDIPATLLLSLENKLGKLRVVFDTIPTLQPGIDWEIDPQAPMSGVYKATHDELSLKTEKDFNFRILVAATDKHPAQVEKWNVDKAVGEYRKVRTSGMLSPKQKSDLLGRLDELLSAVKQARARANTQEVKKLEIGKAIFDHLFKGLGLS